MALLLPSLHQGSSEFGRGHLTLVVTLLLIAFSVLSGLGHERLWFWPRAQKWMEKLSFVKKPNIFSLILS